MNRLLSLVGRILVSVPFLAFGIMNLQIIIGTVSYFAALKVPMTTAAVVVAIIIELLGGLCLVIGFKVRFWAWVMFLYLIPVTFVAHNFWVHAGAARSENETEFLKNIAIMGGLLLLAAFGAGSLSADKS
jgi:putative oxidoreductase